MMISNLQGLGKLLAFIRVGSKGSFSIDPTLTQEMFKMLQEFAHQNNIRMEICTPDQQRIVLFTSNGAMAGAAAGYLVGSLPGLLIGAAIGGTLGYGLAHVRLVVSSPLDVSAGRVELDIL